jgi:sugar phosphate isomerase/epimerase
MPSREEERALSKTSLRLGAPIWSTDDDPEVLARAHRDKGYRAGYCPDIPLDDIDAGSFNPDSWLGPHPDNLSQRFFDAAVENARAIIDAVKPTRTTFCYEMMAWSLPDSPDAALRLLKAVDRKAFSIHLDPCNLVNSPTRYYHSSDVIRECYAKLGPMIASVHAKDLTWDIEMAIHFREVRAGLGSIDYGVWLAEHARHTPEVPLMTEHLETEAEYDAARDHIMAAGRDLGIRFD